MKKKILLILLPIVVMTMVLWTGCSCGSDEPGEITLSFDKAEAYFNGSVELLPIKGDALAASDRFEQATVKISASSAVKMQLSIKLSKEDADTEGIKILVNDGNAKDFANGAVLYESAAEEAEKSLDIKIYIAKDAPVSLKNTTTGFYFVLTYWE